MARIASGADATGHVRLTGDARPLVASATQAKGALVGMETVLKRQGPTMGDFTKKAQAAGIATNVLTGGVLGAVKAFGPWGLAIGVAADAIIHLVSQENQAAEAAKKATKEIRAQNAELERLRANAALARLREDDTAAQRDEIRRMSGGNALDEEKKALEELIAMERGRGRNISGHLTRLAELRAEDLRIQKEQLAAGADLSDRESQRKRKLEERRLEEEALAVLREDELRVLEEQGKEERARTKEKKEQFKWSAELVNQMRLARNASGMQREGSDSRDFAAGLDAARMAQLTEQLKRPRDTEREAAVSKMNLGDSLRAIEAQQDESLEGTLRRIDEEEQARILHNEFMSSIASDEVERIALLDERKQISHEANLARIEAEKQAEQERFRIVDIGLSAGKAATSTIVTGLVSVSDARREATKLARLQGKTEAEAARAGKIAELETRAAQMKGIRDMAIVKSIDHTFEAIGAAARYDFVSAGLHAAAAVGFASLAGIAGVRSNTLSDRADNMGNAASNGFGPAQGGGSGRGAANGSGGGQRGVDSEIPGSPTPKPKGMWQQQTPAQTVINIENVYGTPRKDFIRQITEGQRDLGYSEAS